MTCLSRLGRPAAIIARSRRQLPALTGAGNAERAADEMEQRG
jgi:hypothetical protein